MGQPSRGNRIVKCQVCENALMFSYDQDQITNDVIIKVMPCLNCLKASRGNATEEREAGAGSWGRGSSERNK